MSSIAGEGCEILVPFNERKPLAEVERSLIKTYRKPVWTKFIKAIKDYKLVQEGDKIAVAISGGKDSLIMAKLLQELQKHGRVNFELEYIAMDPGYHENIKELLIDNCKYLDIPIQHASDKILKLMDRKGSKKDIQSLIENLRKKIPEIVLRTSIIVGFPGENEDDFDILYEFVEKVKLDRLGVFIYSREEGTKADKLKLHLDKSTKQKRQNRIMHIQNSISKEINIDRINKVYKTIVEGVSDDGIFYMGRTYAESPQIDPVIYFTSSAPLAIGSFVNVEILQAEEYDLIGAVKDESSE